MFKFIIYIALNFVWMSSVANATDINCKNIINPIYINVSSHGHIYDLVSDAVGGGTDDFDEHHTEIQWLVSAAESVGAKMSLLLNGQYAQNILDQYTIGDPTNYLEHQGFLTSGHTIGAHFHTSFNNAGTWEKYDTSVTGILLEASVSKAWSDHLTAVQSLKGSAVLHVDGAALTATSSFDEPLVTSSYNVKIISVGDNFAAKSWNITPWNPYRQIQLGSLTEDFGNTARPVSIPSIGQVGLSEPNGSHTILATTDQLKRHFILLLAEWREQERLGNEPKIWSFGIMTHPGQNIAYHPDMSVMLNFLELQTQKFGVCGSPLAQFVSDETLSTIYSAWEASTTLTSAFSYTGSYPYTFEDITLALKDADYVASNSTFVISHGVMIYEFRRRIINRTVFQKITCNNANLTGKSIYLLWTNNSAVAPVSINFSGIEAGPVHKLAYASGSAHYTSAVATSSLLVTEQPMLISSDLALLSTPVNNLCVP